MSTKEKNAAEHLPHARLFPSYAVEVKHFNGVIHTDEDGRQVDVRLITPIHAETLYTWYLNQVLWLPHYQLEEMRFIKELKHSFNRITA